MNKFITLPRDEIVRRAIIDLYEVEDKEAVSAVEICDYIGILYFDEVEECIESLVEAGTIKVDSLGVVIEAANNGYFPIVDGGLFDE